MTWLNEAWGMRHGQDLVSWLEQVLVWYTDTCFLFTRPTVAQSSRLCNSWPTLGPISGETVCRLHLIVLTNVSSQILCNIGRHNFSCIQGDCWVLGNVFSFFSYLSPVWIYWHHEWNDVEKIYFIHDAFWRTVLAVYSHPSTSAFHLKMLSANASGLLNKPDEPLLLLSFLLLSSRDWSFAIKLNLIAYRQLYHIHNMQW